MNRGQAFLLGTLAVIGAATFVIVRPFIDYVLAGLLLAYVLFPVHRRLRARVGGMVSAIVLIVATLLTIVIPLIYVLSVFLRDLRRLSRGETALEIAEIEARIVELTGVHVDLAAGLTNIGGTLIDVLFGGVTGVVTVTLRLSLGIVLMLFLVYYLLRDGERFVDWVRPAIPLPTVVTTRLFDKIHLTTWGAVIGHAIAALVQTLITGIGLVVVGFPNVAFWIFVLFVLAFLPLVGVFFVWAPAALYLVLIEETTAGIFLAVYGLTIVSLVDNYARPFVIDQRAQLNPAVILIGVLGGVYTLGFIGLFVGPVLIGILTVTIEIFREEYDRI